MLHSLLVQRFSGANGASFVQSRAYEITDVSTSAVLSVRGSAWVKEASIEPGMILEMSVVVEQGLLGFGPSMTAAVCPWCMTHTEKPTTADTHCWCVPP